MSSQQNTYDQIIEHVFFRHMQPGAQSFTFDRDELEDGARALGLQRPRNLGDVLYTYRFRRDLPESIQREAPEGKSWIIRLAGSGRYRFVAVTLTHITASLGLAETKVPDATPGIIAMYALGDEQALLARLRYNRLIDVFTGITCYSLQSHLRTQISDFGQVETDELYIGVDRRGAHYALPVQAKGGSDRLSVVQIEQDIALCREKFPNLICRPIASQFMANDLIALFELEDTAEGEIRIVSERHYRLAEPSDVSEEDLLSYRLRAHH